MVKDKTIFHVTMAIAIVDITMVFSSLYFGWFGRFINIGIMFCETLQSGLIKQWANTWSSLALVAVGLFIAWSLANRWYHHNRNNLTQGQFYGILFSCLIISMGCGSMALHASSTHTGSVFDRKSMYLIVSFTVSYAALRLFFLQIAHFFFIFLFVFNTCVWAEAQANIHLTFDSFGNGIFAFYILVTILLELLNSIIRKQRYISIWALISFGFLLLSSCIWKMTLTDGPWCDPHSIIQGHAIGHILDALSLYCLFRFYVSEDYELRIRQSLYNV